MVPIKPGTCAGGASRLADGYGGAFTREIRPGVATTILSFVEEPYPFNSARIREPRVFPCVPRWGRETYALVGAVFVQSSSRFRKVARAMRAASGATLSVSSGRRWSGISGLRGPQYVR